MVSTMNEIRFASLAALSALLGCASGFTGDECVTSADCEAGEICVDEMCVFRGRSDGGGRDSGPVGVDSGPALDLGGADGGPVDGGFDFGPPPMCTDDADCDDSSLCTTEACVGDSCMVTAVTCDDGDACTDDGCDPATGCTTSTTSCDDGDACTTDSCDSSTGCAHAPVVAAGGTCASPIDISAGGTFTGDSTCAASDFSGVCTGTAAPDVAFVLDLASQSVVTLNAGASSFGLVLFVGSSCGSASGGCNSSGTANLSVTLPAGRHYVALDGRAVSDSGAWSLSVGITPVVTNEIVTFPAAGDTRATLYPSPWNFGDYIQGTRTTSLSSVTGAQMNLAISPNGLSCDTQDMRLRINGTIVGNVIIPPGAASVTRSFSFSAISGPSYTFRLENIRTVATGCGAAGIPNGSTLTLTR